MCPAVVSFEFGRVRQEGGSVIKVRPRGNESIQQMLKRFKRLCQREGLTRDMKRHSYYEKPSERKRRQARKSVRRVDRDGTEGFRGGRD